MINHPTLTGVETPESAGIISSSATTFTLSSAPANTTNHWLVIEVSEPRSNGITRAHGKAAAFGAPVTPSKYAIGIKSNYKTKCGAPSA